MATELPTDPQIAVDAGRYLAQRVLTLEAEVERLRALVPTDEENAEVRRLKEWYLKHRAALAYDNILSAKHAEATFK